MLKKVGIVVFWVALWALIAFAAGNPLVLASPADVAVVFAQRASTAEFWLSIGITLLHIGLGLVAACVLGCLLGVLAFRFPLVGEMISPLVSFVKSAPIVCFIVLLLVWCGARWTDFVTVFIAVFPLYYFALYEASRQRDGALAEMLRVFRVPDFRRFVIFEWPAVFPFFRQATQNAVGISWKSGITAELIGLTFGSVGESIYLSKLSLDTATLFMWTIVAVLCAWACEKIVLRAADALQARLRKRIIGGCQEQAGDCPAPRDIVWHDVSKSYGENRVVVHDSRVLSAGERITLTQPTGYGKTTIASLVLSVISPDEGAIDGLDQPMSAVFQEPHLLAGFTAEQNIALVAQCSLARARSLLGELLDESVAEKEVGELSGGMKRCVELARALAANSAVVVLDEPFAGLDVSTQARAEAFIDAHLEGRTLLLVTHQ